jgi:hypothetical protein
MASRSKRVKQDDINSALNNTIKDLVRESQEWHRPRLFLDIVPGKKTNIMDILLRNSGGSPAYGIDCTFEPDLPYYDKKQLSELAVFRDLPFLEQNQEIRFFFGDFVSIMEDAKFPKITNVELKYTDSKGNHFKERYAINLERYKGILSPESRDMGDIVKELEHIRRQLDNIRSRGIIVKTVEDVKKEEQALKEWMNQKKA